MQLAYFINHRPLLTLSAVAGLRDTIMGAALILGLDETRMTGLFQNFDALWPGVAGLGIGWLLFLSGLFVFLSSIRGKYKWANRFLRMQSVVWLFSAFSYFFAGHIILGLVLGMAFAFHSWYLSYLKTDHLTAKPRRAILMRKRE